ncbi:pyrroline-5-carboxylate reductase [Candidatus Peribacteria bacterium]|jgi:pyrroline-5-carboxylate reductase|nr:pyrroline-5-carboxylate reductase [Candidatus Peribacteria bacterium]MBT4021612.1 pyrroline-5-carboxylate reductase [Candidatus Peribacteria bacterium]MBT4240493.1 pyrroline-5-carboxylate reductase [Candidatus Peribacteria bacterium]MBT4474326.1 pyrroline-5-carboxylate reductase [Candidatus Peribacteria bacterium]
MPNRIAIIGAGNMGGAMFRGLIESFEKDQISICDKNQEKLDALNIGNVDIEQTLSNANTVIFAVKPQSFEECISGIETNLSDKLVISIMAGISLEGLQNRTKSKRVIRSMPNICSQVGEGITAWIASQDVSDDDKEITKKIFEAVGRQVEIDNEEMIDTISATTGAGPAYFFLLCELLAKNLEKLGFSEDDAKTLSEQTFVGSAALLASKKSLSTRCAFLEHQPMADVERQHNSLEESSLSAKELRESVTSKGGITQAALETFKEAGLNQIIEKAITAAIKRSKELN